jgi:Ras-related protein Rab-1A
LLKSSELCAGRCVASVVLTGTRVAARRRYACSSVNKLLVGNKNDLPQNRAVPTEEAQKFADEMGIELIETSAKTATNVQESFMKMARQIKDR